MYVLKNSVNTDDVCTDGEIARSSGEVHFEFTVKLTKVSGARHRFSFSMRLS